MEVELEPRVKPLTYKVRAMSRESPTQKAAHVLDSDLRSHWSTGTNTKEWILLELQEPCLLSHIRVYNKSVLEWEISAGLRYKPETFVKVRPRCEAPRREMVYPMNYTPCRYVRVSCLRGNPIAIFFVQLIGVSMASLEPEFQPVVDYLLPHIIAHKQDAHDMHLKLLEDITNRLQPFLPQLEADLTNFFDDAESNIRFLSMLSGPFYPLLYIVNERDIARTSSSGSESEASKNNHSQTTSVLTVSSNFEPRKSRIASPYGTHSSSATAFRADTIILLLRKAYKDSNLRTICCLASKIMQKLVGPLDIKDLHMPASCTMSSDLDEMSKSGFSRTLMLADYSDLFGEEFRILDYPCDSSYLNILDIGAVEEGIFHVLYGTASQPTLCHKLADGTSDMWSALPLIQALLPVLRPYVSSPHYIDDTFSLWKQPLVQQALSQIIATSSAFYRPLLHAAAGYLSSFSQSHVKAACILIDLCCGVLAPWMPQVTAKVDLAVELVEDLLGVFQDVRHSVALARSRAALKYVVLALSGRMDDILAKFKEVKHEILFLVEMLEPLLDPVIVPNSGTLEFVDASLLHTERGDNSCDLALNIIRVAVNKSAVLPSLESEWRRGLVAPSVLLSVLDPHMQLPMEVDKCKTAVCKSSESESLNASPISSTLGTGSASTKTNSEDDSEAKLDITDSALKMDTLDDVSLFFAPLELKALHLESSSDNIELSSSRSDDQEKMLLSNSLINLGRNCSELDTGSIEHTNLQADYFHLINYQDCELRASKFRHLALDLHSQSAITLEAHNAAIDALLLAAECYVNPFFMMSFSTSLTVSNQTSSQKVSILQKDAITELKRVFEQDNNMELLAQTERKRDKYVIQLLLEAATLDKNFHEQLLKESDQNYSECLEESIMDLSMPDLDYVDAITLVRQNQSLLFNFLIRQLQRDQHPMHEILMQSLLFVLHSATKLFCAPDSIIDIILSSAGYLNSMLTSFYYQFKEGRLQLEIAKVHEVQRRWMLLQKLVRVSSGNDQALDAISETNVSHFGNLFPSSAWIHRIPSFSKCSSPLVRFLGWMAVSRNAKQYLKERLILSSDLEQLTSLLSIFSDELALIENAVSAKENMSNSHSGPKKYPHDYSGKTFCVLYPDLSKFFPQMKKQFEVFGEIILDSVGTKLRTLPTDIVPDMLCWFSNFCVCPFLQKDQLSGLSNSAHLKGYVAKNAKAIILYILETIVVEHMEAIVPEIPRVVQVLMSICRSSYSDVSFLDSMLCLVRPIITFSLRKKTSVEEKSSFDDSCLNFESLCFHEFFHCIGRKTEKDDSPTDKDYHIALMIYVLATIFPDLSFNRKRELLASLRLWADFASFETTKRIRDYLSAFCVVMESCRTILRQISDVFGVATNYLSQSSEISLESIGSYIPTSLTAFGKDTNPNSASASTIKLLAGKIDGETLVQKPSYSVEDIENLCQDLESLILILNPTLELCWNFHSDLAKKLVVATSECLVLLKSLSSVVKTAEVDSGNLCLPNSDEPDNDKCIVPLNAGIKGLTEYIVSLPEKHCWEVASVMLDCLLKMPQYIYLDDVLASICFTLKVFSGRAPKLGWRLKTDKWLSSIFARGIQTFHEKESPLIDLFCSMLGHFEPEQRFVALKHLGGLVNKHMNAMEAEEYATHNHDLRYLSGTIDEKVLTNIVSSTWDQVVVMASSDALVLLRMRAVALLRDFVPFVGRKKLQSFLSAADNVLQGFGEHSNTFCDGSLLQLSLALLCNACIHSPHEDIYLIPENVWMDIEAYGTSKTDRELGDLEKKACQALCRLRSEGDGAKEVLKEVISSNPCKQYDPELQNTRESILQVLSNVTSVRAYFEVFSEKIDEETMEIEEAEMELEILQKVTDGHESSNGPQPNHQLTCPVGSDMRSGSRLQQIKDSIRSLEKAKIRDEIMRRRQNKTLARQARQKRLEEAARREAELIEELDRERITEAEREIERQRALEIERVKTRELRHNLELEKERQLQRELQRELEQAESGLRSSRREYPSSGHGGRPKDRFRERDVGRPGEENTRNNGGNFQTESSNTAPALVLSSSRTFSGQPPTILPRDRPFEAGSSYEENFDGSNYSGDTCSIGEPELGSAFDGQIGGYGLSQRQSSRGPKSRQVTDKREKEGRREGKWERKH